MSQDGALCVWECDTELDGLLPEKPREAQPQEMGEEEEEEAEGQPRAEVIRGKSDGNRQQGSKHVHYKRLGK